jgi:hypothetical protein
MSTPLEISFKTELLFIRKLLIPSFDTGIKFETTSERKNWIRQEAIKTGWSSFVCEELITMYSTVKSLKEAKEVKVEAEMKVAEENERKQGTSTSTICSSFIIFSLFCLSFLHRLVFLFVVNLLSLLGSLKRSRQESIIFSEEGHHTNKHNI